MKPQVKGSKVMGFCHTAQMVESGVINSSTAPARWHSMCKATYVATNARVSICACECHGGQTVCSDCGAVNLEFDPKTGVCVDREACVLRLKEKLAEAPSPALAGARARRAEKGRREANGSKGKAKVGRCEHCGSPTGGGRFTVGHDAKLKSELSQPLKGWMKGTWQGDPITLIPDAAELLVRSWMRPELQEALPSEFVAQARSLADQDGFLVGRVAARVPIITTEGASVG